MNQSIFYVALQITNLIIGLFISIYIAVNIDPKTYSIYAIYMIVIGFFATFSSIGYETVLIRNSLKWQKNKPSKISRYIINTFVVRLILSFFLMLLVWLYLYWISETKYEGQYLVIFSLFLIAGLFSSINNATSLILRSFNRYLVSFSISILGLLFTKIIAFSAFLKYGFDGFILVMIFAPIIIFIASIKLISPYITKFIFKLKYLKNFRQVISFAYLGYFKYFINSFDKLIISALLAPEILASYSIAKQMQNAGKGLIEGFFDPLCQKIIKYKGNINDQLQYLSRLNAIKIFLIILGTFLGTICIIYINEIVTFLGLNKYKYFISFIVCAILCCMIYLAYKVEFNLISLFEQPRKLIYLDMTSFGLFLLTLILIFFLNAERLLYLAQIVSQIFLLIFSWYLWLSKKNIYLKYKGL